jgi:hypothetical protein
MYYYYFQSTRGYQPWWKMYLTRLQISQLFSFVVLGTIGLGLRETPFRFFVLLVLGSLEVAKMRPATDTKGAL